MCCLGVALRLNVAPQRVSVAETLQHPLTFQHTITNPLRSIARRHLSLQREALADIKTKVDKNFNVTRESKTSGLWESVIGLEVHAQVMNARLRLTVSNTMAFRSMLLPKCSPPPPQASMLQSTRMSHFSTPPSLAPCLSSTEDVSRPGC